MQATSLIQGWEFVVVVIATLAFAAWALVRLLSGWEGAVKAQHETIRELTKANLALSAQTSAQSLAHSMERTDQLDGAAAGFADRELAHFRMQQ